MAVASNSGFSGKESFNIDDQTFEVKEINKAKLVVLVYQHPNLWKVDSQEFSQKSLVEQSWRQISVELGCNVEYWEHVKRKWKTVKDEYVKWHRYCNNPPPEGLKVRKRAYKPLFQSMEFLDPYLRHRNTGLPSRPTNAHPPKQVAAAANGHLEAAEKPLLQVDFSPDSPGVVLRTSQKRPNSKLSNTPNSTSLQNDGSIISLQDEPQMKKEAKENTDDGFASQRNDLALASKKNGSDGVRHFLDDISVTLQKLPDNKLQYAKMKIQLFLYNLQYGTSDTLEAQDNLD